jgi:hypothetical protein
VITAAASDVPETSSLRLPSIKQSCFLRDPMSLTRISVEPQTEPSWV